MAEVYSSLFKGNVHITTPFSSSHKGIDLGNYKVKNPIYSPNKLGNGTVSKIATSYTSSGVPYNNTLVIWVTYDSGYVMSLYHGEVKDKIVNVGDRVIVGQQIYRTGNTGHSHGDHLHCAISKKGVYIDPAPLVINDFVTPPPVTPPVPPSAEDDLRRQVSDLSKQIEGLKNDLATSFSLLNEKNARVGELESELGLLKDRNKFLEENYTLLKEEDEKIISKLESDLELERGVAKKLEEELNKLKAERNTWLNRLVSFLYKLFTKK